MCSPVSDGAAAAIVCNRDALMRLGVDSRRAIRVLSSVIQTGADRAAENVERHVTALAGKRAYELAGVGPLDVSVAEVHDATAMGEIFQIENLGFCGFGEGYDWLDGGRRIALDGDMPVNPHGGQLSEGRTHGYGFLYEAVAQLRHEAGERRPDAYKHHNW